jgi:hypothetical protein
MKQYPDSGSEIYDSSLRAKWARRNRAVLKRKLDTKQRGD